jgi:hypothetical protein
MYVGYIIGYIRNFFYFSKTCKCDSRNFLNNKIAGARGPKTLSAIEPAAAF